VKRQVGLRVGAVSEASDGSSALVQISEYQDASKAEIAGRSGLPLQLPTGACKAAELK